MTKAVDVYYYEKDGVFQASRVKLDHFVFDPSGPPFVGVDTTLCQGIERID